MTDPVVTHAPGEPKLLLGAYDIASLGYTDDEFFVSGSASSYAPVGELGSDGRWDAAPSEVADYTTRIVVLKPSDVTKFNGTVIVEWLNVSGGIDAPAIWFMAHRELIREGYAYVAVSAQQVGIEGGASLGMDMSLKKQDPERYWHLSHPEDAFSYDIFSQIGRLIHDAAGTGVLGPLNPEFVVAVGESQSAMFLTTYVNAVDPLVNIYDGYLIHSRFGPAAPLDGSSIFATPDASAPQGVKFRPDLRVPLVTALTETDLVGGVRPGYYLARQPDTEWLRAWEIPGTAHADNYTIQVGRIDTGFAPLEELVAAYAPTNTLMGQQLPHYINFAPQHHYVLQAAIAGLHGWIRTGVAPSKAARMELSDTDPPRLALDGNGLAKGGVRTPWVGVPIARTSGVGTERALCPICSAPASPSMPPPSPGCIPAVRRSTSSASRSHWMRQSSQAFSGRRIARRSLTSLRPPILAVSEREQGRAHCRSCRNAPAEYSGPVTGHQLHHLGSDQPAGPDHRDFHCVSSFLRAVDLWADLAQHRPGDQPVFLKFADGDGDVVLPNSGKSFSDSRSI